QYWDDLSLEAIQQARATQVKLAAEEHPSTDAPEVASLATQMLQSVVGADAIKHGGYQVETAIDLDLQVQTRNALRVGLTALDTRNHLLGPLKAHKQRRKTERVKDLVVGHSYDAVVTASNDARGEIILDLGGHRVVASMADVTRWNPNHLSASE